MQIIFFWKILFAFLFVFFLIFFILPLFFGAPYDVSRKKALKNIIKLTNPKKGDRIAELGSGDGRVCITLAKKNKKALIHGFEINPFLVWISRKKIRKLKLENQIKIYWKNFWLVNLSSYNKIILFQYKSIMKKLEKKLKKELKKGSKIISHNWKFPELKIRKQLGKHSPLQGIVYLYKI